MVRRQSEPRVDSFGSENGGKKTFKNLGLGVKKTPTALMTHTRKYTGKVLSRFLVLWPLKNIFPKICQI